MESPTPDRMFGKRHLAFVRRRGLVVAAVALLYCGAYLLLLGPVGSSISAFVVFPIVVAAWAFGMWGGLAAALVGLFLLNPGMRLLTGQELVLSSWIGVTLVVTVATFIGRISELQRNLGALLDARDASEAANRLLLREQVAREEAERGRKQVEQVLESITDGFFALDAEWRFTYVNERAERAFERNRQLLVGRSIWEELPRVFGSAFRDELEAAAAARATTPPRAVGQLLRGARLSG
jgi:PAS domain-containing protein